MVPMGHPAKLLFSRLDTSNLNQFTELFNMQYTSVCTRLTLNAHQWWIILSMKAQITTRISLGGCIPTLCSTQLNSLLYTVRWQMRVEWQVVNNARNVSLKRPEMFLLMGEKSLTTSFWIRFQSMMGALAAITIEGMHNNNRETNTYSTTCKFDTMSYNSY